MKDWINVLLKANDTYSNLKGITNLILDLILTPKPTIAVKGHDPRVMGSALIQMIPVMI